MTKKACKDCVFFSAHVSPHGKLSPDCRRLSPETGGWPGVNEDDWCGEGQTIEGEVYWDLIQRHNRQAANVRRVKILKEKSEA